MATDIEFDHPDLQQLIADMFQTMEHAQGIGLAAPQIGKSIRLFIIDTVELLAESEESEEEGLRQVFINAHKVEETGSLNNFEEGCLSIPDVRGDVERPTNITLHYFDENFQEHTQTFTGVNARVIQHEYDHIDGILFTEKLKPLKKRLVRRKLDNIRKGKVKADYRMKFVSKK